MDIRFLATFVEVAKTRHFGKAAENLYLTQSAISARIKLLEEYFGTSLFYRYRHGIRLTSAGEKLLPHAEIITKTLNEAKKALAEIDLHFLVVAGTPNAWEFSMQQWLSAMKQHFPEVSLRAEVMNNDHLSRQLHERTIDLAFTLEPLKSEEFGTSLLQESKLALYSSKEELTDEEFISYVMIDWGAKASEYMEKQFPETRRSHFRTSSVQIGLDYMLANGGCIVLPEILAADYVEQKKMHLVKPLPELSIKLYLNYMRDVKQLGLSDYITFLKNTVE